MGGVPPAARSTGIVLWCQESLQVVFGERLTARVDQLGRRANVEQTHSTTSGGRGVPPTACAMRRMISSPVGAERRSAKLYRASIISSRGEDTSEQKAPHST